MSHEWIEAKLDKSVGEVMAATMLDADYSRHLFFCPACHPGGSKKAHMQAKLTNAPCTEHLAHAAFNYDEVGAKVAVNKRKAALRKRHGNLPGLRVEK